MLNWTLGQSIPSSSLKGTDASPLATTLKKSEAVNNSTRTENQRGQMYPSNSNNNTPEPYGCTTNTCIEPDALLPPSIDMHPTILMQTSSHSRASRKRLMQMVITRFYFAPAQPLNQLEHMRSRTRRSSSSALLLLPIWCAAVLGRSPPGNAFHTTGTDRRLRFTLKEDEEGRHLRCGGPTTIRMQGASQAWRIRQRNGHFQQIRMCSERKRALLSFQRESIPKVYQEIRRKK